MKRTMRLALVVGLCAWSCAGVAAWGQNKTAGMAPPARKAAMSPPDLSGSVLRALEAAYLSEEERRALRVFHGVWREDDLADTALRAQAALMVMALDDPSLHDARAAAEDRAEAALLRGELDASLVLLEGRSSLRAMRIRAEALEAGGRFGEAAQAIKPVVDSLMRESQTDAAELTEGVRALAIGARLAGRPAGDYQQMMRLLARARQDLDRLYWPAAMSEAELLLDKDNRKEARDAAIEVLGMNPSCARAWAILGQQGVDSFDFGTAESVASRMDVMVRRLTDDPGAVNPMGALILARAALRQNDPDLAGEHVDRVLSMHPEMRDAVALRCAVAALRYDYEELDRALAAFDGLSPGSPLALYEAGRVLSEHRQYGPAAAYLGAALERQPNWAAPVIELGLLEMQSGRDTRALTALRRATELDPFHVRARNSLTLIEELLTYETVRSENFIVRYKPGVDGVMARDMLEPLEWNHAIVAEAFQHEPSQPTVIELMPDHEWFAVRITGMPGVHTIAAATGPVIAMEAPKIGKRHNGVYDWVRVVRHEYAHTVTLSRTNNRIPHWFTEAAAVHMELAPRDYETWRLLINALTANELFDLRAINVAFVRPKKPTDRSLAYAQGHWMYEFTVERWSDSAPIELMDRYALGVPEDAAMQEVLGMSVEAFHAAFLDWAKEDARRHGMLPSPSVKALLLEESLADPEHSDAMRGQLGDLARITAHRMAGAIGAVEKRVSLLPSTPEMVSFFEAQHPDHPDLLEQRVAHELARAGGRAEESMIPLLERYAHARPVDPLPHRELARLRLASDDPSSAIEHLEFLDAREQRSAAYAVELARRYAALGDWNRAHEKALRATWIAPYDGNYRELVATIAIQRGRLEQARHQLEALVELEPDREQHRKRLEAIEQMIARRAG